jgi:malate dehydrogenase (oxaloacetate-decarboxylating)(NADP+)
MYIVQTKKGPFFFGDTTVNIQPTAQTLVDTTILTARAVENVSTLEPVIAMVSYSNFGSIRDGSPKRVNDAIEILHREYPGLHR